MNQIHPLAVVDPEAKLGDGNIIGPFCVIDKNVIIMGEKGSFAEKYANDNSIQFCDI